MLLSLPVISKLRQTAGTLHFAGKKEIGLFLKNIGVADEITDPGGPLYLPLYSGREDGRLSSMLGNFDSAYVFSSKKNSVAAEGIRKNIPDTKTILTIPDDTSTHAADYRFMQAFGQTLNSLEHNMFIDLPETVKRHAEDALRSRGHCFDRPLVSVHAGSGGASKYWPLERYLALAERLITEENHFVALFSGEAESGDFKKEVSSFSGRYAKHCLHVCCKDLTAVAAFIGLSDIYIGNDSGISHLAGTIAKRAVVIFGPTNPAIWRPSGSNVETVSANVRCAPCDPKVALLCGRECLLKISIEDVYASIKGEGRTTGLHP